MRHLLTYQVNLLARSFYWTVITDFSVSMMTVCSLCKCHACTQ